jgi:hypothetical protein
MLYKEEKIEVHKNYVTEALELRIESLKVKLDELQEIHKRRIKEAAEDIQKFFNY